MLFDNPEGFEGAEEASSLVNGRDVRKPPPSPSFYPIIQLSPPQGLVSSNLEKEYW